MAERALILASASPRRHRLLAEAGLVFEIEPADVDETIDSSLESGEVAEDLARRKAAAVAQRHLERGLERSTAVIGSDTIVVLGSLEGGSRRFLEKAADEGEAREMLQALSGTRHRVITGVAVAFLEPGDAFPRTAAAHETTWVTMRDLAEDELAAYVASGEWRGKAGSYAIQETADRFVTGLEGGGFDNVVGLPVALTLRLLGSPRPC